MEVIGNGNKESNILLISVLSLVVFLILTVPQKYHISKYFLQRIKVASVIQTKSGTTCLLNYDLSGGHIIDFPTILLKKKKIHTTYLNAKHSLFIVSNFKIKY